MLFEIGIPSFDTVVHNNLVCFTQCWHVCSNYNAVFNYLVHLKCKLQLQWTLLALFYFIFLLYYNCFIHSVCVVISRFVCVFFVYFNVGLIFLSSLSLILLYYYCLWAKLPDSK